MWSTNLICQYDNELIIPTQTNRIWIVRLSLLHNTYEISFTNELLHMTRGNRYVQNDDVDNDE